MNVRPDNTSAEFAILVDSSIKGRGLGRKLMTKMIGYLRRRGTRKIEGQILLENEAMLRLATTLGFTIRPLDGIAMSATLDLT